MVLTVNYRVEDIEDQIIATLQLDDALNTVDIRTHAGEINAGTFLNEITIEEIRQSIPFILIQYQGREWMNADETRQVNRFRLKYRIYVGASSMRTKQEGQRSAYGILGAIYDDIQGSVPYSVPQKLEGITGVTGKILAGIAITDVDFSPMTVLRIAPGQDERIMVNMPDLVVYSTDYAIDVNAWTRVVPPGGVQQARFDSAIFDSDKFEP